MSSSSSFKSAMSSTLVYLLRSLIAFLPACMELMTPASKFALSIIIFCCSSNIYCPSSFASSFSYIFICFIAVNAPLWSPAFFFAIAYFLRSAVLFSSTFILLSTTLHCSVNFAMVSCGSTGFASTTGSFFPNNLLNIFINY